MTVIGVSFLLLLVCLAVQCERDDQTAKTHVGEFHRFDEDRRWPFPSLAIVGAGIGGISTAYWLKHYLNDSIAITIYETDRVSQTTEEQSEERSLMCRWEADWERSMSMATNTKQVVRWSTRKTATCNALLTNSVSESPFETSSWSERPLLLLSGLKRINDPSSTSYLMTDDGSQTLFSTLSQYVPSLFLTLWRYGLDAFRLKFWLSKTLSNFVR